MIGISFVVAVSLELVAMGSRLEKLSFVALEQLLPCHLSFDFDGWD